ncbi:His-Xaa-Ser system radical SAM maturase HxsC [Marinobacter halodurans]|uniref:His-Xaa-Ser system radical SAM maturase HxsC n=1 Tax=Marinobacter halodurans TaxID=2528979 RepID=A0ABY1ZI57_9GAMM|nr:His-Xaa-Ser system radical SAM maturase HxsC [Marinobacter halodurans]TBW49534.1 His-Xaa-Ser system radical SAM maturase HxsC [Marinobacter halodurans]
MREAIRQDVFAVPEANLVPAGCWVLRKTLPTTPDTWLNTLLVTGNGTDASSSNAGDICTIHSPELFDSIEDGDVGLVNGRGSVRVILSRRANHNTVLVTERCDNRCLFCSQPPKDRNDDELLMQAAAAIISFAGNDVIGVSGGEPLLYGDAFLRFLEIVQTHAPETGLHVLSNGRAFADRYFARAVAERLESPVVFGIPLYAALAEVHDTLVGAAGAHADTVRGLINAGNAGIPIELRIIPTQKNLQELVPLLELALRCFSGLQQVSVMNLEPTGWARANWGQLYCDPSLYADQLTSMVRQAEAAGLPIALFNYPLCHLPDTLHPWAVQSISDWKNYYPDTCSGCTMRPECGGFFSSSQGQFHQSPRIIS